MSRLTRRMKESSWEVSKFVTTSFLIPVLILIAESSNAAQTGNSQDRY